MDGTGRLVGTVCMVTAFTEALNAHIFRNVPPYFVYFNGLCLLSAGLTLARLAPPTRTKLRPIHVLGPVLTIGGLFRMLFPDAKQPSAETSPLAFYGATGVMFALGLAVFLDASD